VPRFDSNEYQYEYLVTAEAVLRFALSIGITDDQYLSELRDPAGSGMPAPPMFYLALAMESGRLVPRQELGLDGLPLAEDVDGVRVTAGETSVELYKPVHVGDSIRVTQRHISAEQKNGKSGPFVLQRLTREYARQDGELVVREQYSRILRSDA
jgi:acyl dehydratase